MPSILLESSVFVSCLHVLDWRTTQSSSVYPRSIVPLFMERWPINRDSNTAGRRDDSLFAMSTPFFVSPDERARVLSSKQRYRTHSFRLVAALEGVLCLCELQCSSHATCTFAPQRTRAKALHFRPRTMSCARQFVPRLDMQKGNI